MSGFFPEYDGAPERKPLPLVAKCGACGLHKTCQSPFMPVYGKGKRKILVVGEAPGAVEDKRNKPFQGESGELTQTVFEELGADLFRDCWVTNALICRPPHNFIKKEAMIEYCRPNVFKVIKELKPEVIILFGKRAVHSVIGHAWKEEVGAMTRWAGWRIPCQNPRAWICPTYHPSYVLRSEKQPVVALWFKRHLKQALRRN